MSNKKFIISVSGQRELMKSIRGTIPLRASQVHSSKNSYKRHNKHIKNWTDE